MAVKQFRIERLEERIAPSKLCFAGGSHHGGHPGHHFGP